MFAEFFNDFAVSFERFLSTIRFADIIDMAIVAFIIYHTIRLIRETRAEQLIKGIFVLIILLQLSIWFGLNTMQWILQNTMQLGFLALLVVFQPELRRALEQMGRSSIGRVLTLHSREETVSNTIEEVSRAVDVLAKNKVGALICMERLTKLGDIIKTGTQLGADITAELLVNIFVPNTPLHDGAVIIGGNKVLAAACFLPLTHNNDLSRELGTRHRAAIGLSENSDAIVIVVSEETGKISIARDGDLTRGLTVETLKKALTKTLQDETGAERKKKLLFWREKKS